LLRSRRAWPSLKDWNGRRLKEREKKEHLHSLYVHKCVSAL
jgi:hypothetical protein